MRETCWSEMDLLKRDLESKTRTAYDSICPPMSRAERRTARGRLLQAQAEIAALRVEVDYLRSLLPDIFNT